MKMIKEDIQTREVLQTKLRSVMQSGLADFIKTTNARRISVRASIRFSVVAILFIVAIAVFLFLAQININTFFGKVILMIALLWTTVLLVSGRSWFIGSTLLAREVNMALVPILANTFNRTLLYTYNEEADSAVRELLEESFLVTSKITHFAVKNVYTVFGDVEMRVHEIVLGLAGDESHSKSKKQHGTFIEVTLHAEYPGETVFSTAGSRFGFSQTDFIKCMNDEERFTTVNLPGTEYPDLAVFSTNETESRTFDTTELLQSIHAWGNASSVNIRVMHKGAKLYILVPASKESVTYTSTSTKRESIERYAELIAGPIWRGLMVAEEVK